jgi:hypothetical protein
VIVQIMQLFGWPRVALATLPRSAKLVDHPNSQQAGIMFVCALLNIVQVGRQPIVHALSYCKVHTLSKVSAFLWCSA